MGEPLPETMGEIERLDPAVDQLLPADARIEVLAGGFAWSEGPVWIKEGGYLLFSDIPRNRINRWQDGQLSVFLEPSGYTGKEEFTGREPGTNGLAVDREGRLVMCCHGDHCIARLEKDGTRTVLVDRYRGKRLNSPNDLVVKSNGDIYFTDPPYGMPKEPVDGLGFFGIYRFSADGRLTLLYDKMTRPNGLAFSPDEKTLYVSQSDREAAIWNAFPVDDQGLLGPPRVFFSAQEWVGKRPGSPDGLKVDIHGNLWATGPGGVLILSPEGKYLGRLNTGQRTANCAWGDDGSTLYLTADRFLCRVRTSTRGAGW